MPASALLSGFILPHLPYPVNYRLLDRKDVHPKGWGVDKRIKSVYHEPRPNVSVRTKTIHGRKPTRGRGTLGLDPNPFMIHEFMNGIHSRNE